MTTHIHYYLDFKQALLYRCRFRDRYYYYLSRMYLGWLQQQQYNVVRLINEASCVTACPFFPLCTALRFALSRIHASSKYHVI